MALPISRNTTYGAASPILSNDLNALQDCVVGAKTPSLTTPLYAGDWRPEAASVTFSVGNGKWTWAGFDDLTIGINVPVGTRITGAKWNYNRTAGTFNFKIQKRAAAAGAWTDIVTGTDNATVGAGTKTLACAEVTVADTQYRLYIDSSGASTFDVASYVTDRL